jgi:hypothetical protein
MYFSISVRFLGPVVVVWCSDFLDNLQWNSIVLALDVCSDFLKTRVNFLKISLIFRHFGWFRDVLFSLNFLRKCLIFKHFMPFSSDFQTFYAIFEWFSLIFIDFHVIFTWKSFTSTVVPPGGDVKFLRILVQTAHESFALSYHFSCFLVDVQLFIEHLFISCSLISFVLDLIGHLFSDNLCDNLC